MAGNTSFPGAVDGFSKNTPTPTTTTTDTADSTGRKHAERHDDMEAAMEAVQTYLLATGWDQSTNDPLTSTTNLTTNTGTWSIDTYLKCVPPNTTTQCRAMHSATVPGVLGLAVVEVEIEIPSGFSGAGYHIGIGFQTSPSVTGAVTLRLRGDNYVYWESDGSSAGGTTAYTMPAAGTWVKLRMHRKAEASWDAYVDGTFIVNQTAKTQSWAVDSLKPYVVTYGPTVRFRNLKAWGYADASSTLPA
jgi:hypothetical protein